MGIVPAIGFAVFDIRASDSPREVNSPLRVNQTAIENYYYVVTLDDSSNVISIYDKNSRRELLAGPVIFQFLRDKPDRWPAWEIGYNDVMSKPLEGVIKSTRIEILESGPVRASLLVTQKTDNSTIRTVVSLSAGDAGDRVTFDVDVDWYERETLLKAAFKFTTANDSVTYDIGLGTIKRGIDRPELYEVPGQQWADMTSKDGSYGIAVLNDCKYGWDHPDSATMRLTLIHTPGVFENWNWVGDQKSQDNGHHKFAFAIMGHKGDWREGRTVWQAVRLNQSFLAFQTTPHDGPLGKEFSLVHLSDSSKGKSKSNPQVLINAMKLAEDNDEIVIRLRELTGKPANDVRVHFAWPIVSAREINGAEEALADAQVRNGALVTALGPYQPRAFAIRLNPMKIQQVEKPQYYPMPLPFNIDGISYDSNRKDGDFDGEGNTLSGELLPDMVFYGDIPFVIGPRDNGAANVLACDGRTLRLPKQKDNRLYLLLAAVNGPIEAAFAVDSSRTQIWIQDYALPLGQWNNRLVGDAFVEEPDQIAPAYINREPVAWYGTHRHNAKGENEAYQFTYLYLARPDLPANARSLTLPDNPRIRLLAATVAKCDYDLKPLQPLYDYTNSTLSNIHSDRHAFIDSTKVTISCPIPGAQVRFTIDGSEPTESSLIYSHPFTMTRSGTVKSRALGFGVDDKFVARAEFTKLVLRDAVIVGKTAPGLQCAYFEGSWSVLPDFDSLTAMQDTFMNSITIPDFARKEDFGLAFRGYIKIERDGLYTFYLNSDDGSILYIGDSLVVNNDGLHGEGDVVGEIALKTGCHPITVRMFQAKGDEALSLAMSGPGIERAPVPKEILYHSVKSRRGR